MKWLLLIAPVLFAVALACGHAGSAQAEPPHCTPPPFCGTGTPEPTPSPQPIFNGGNGGAGIGQGFGGQGGNGGNASSDALAALIASLTATGGNGGNSGSGAVSTSAGGTGYGGTAYGGSAHSSSSSNSTSYASASQEQSQSIVFEPSLSNVNVPIFFICLASPNCPPTPPPPPVQCTAGTPIPGGPPDRIYVPTATDFPFAGCQE